MAESNPLVSVIIPAYNRAAYITDAINSVFEQQDAPWPLEVIVIDDGSTDNTQKVVKKAFGDRVRYIKIQQSGGRPAVPRNVGLNLAKCELVAFHDSDDLWTPDKLKSQIPLFEQDKNLVLSYGTAEIMDERGHKSGNLVVPDMDRLAGGEQYETLLQDNVISTLTVVARKDALAKAGNFNEAKSLGAVEDYELWLRVAAKYPGRVKAVKKALAYYRQHDGNISHGGNAKALGRLNAVFTAQTYTKLTDTQRKALEDRAVKNQTNLGRLRNDPDSPLVSVVMSVYNGEKFLRPALESILNQTYRAFEFIIIDDGSTDNSARIIASYDDPRIRLMRRANRGLAFSLNQGAAMARGQFIARMDADDVSLPTRLEKQVHLLLGNEKLGVVGSFFTYIDEKTNKPGLTITSPTKSLDLRRALYIYNPFPHGGTTFRREAFDEAGGYTDNYGPIEDYDLWCRISDKEWEFAQIPEPLYLYRLSENGISNQKKDEQAEYGAKLINERWHKPWIHKGVRTIIKGGNYYKRMDSPFANEVFHQYIHHQYILAVELFARKHFKTGMITAIGACALDRALWRKLWRPIAAGFLRKIGLKEAKT